MTILLIVLSLFLGSNFMWFFLIYKKLKDISLFLSDIDLEFTLLNSNNL